MGFHYSTEFVHLGDQASSIVVQNIKIVSIIAQIGSAERVFTLQGMQIPHCPSKKECCGLFSAPLSESSLVSVASLCDLPSPGVLWITMGLLSGFHCAWWGVNLSCGTIKAPPSLALEER